MAPRRFDEVNGGGVDHFWVMVLRRFEDTSKVALGLQSRCAALLLLGRPHVLSAAHGSTSVQHSEQISRDVIDGSVAIHPMEQALRFIPSSQWRGLFVIGGKAIQDR